ncbi:hypothetical protein GCM10027511_07360 [Hymenobacter humi]
MGELDGLLLKAINEMAAEGWELLEIRAVSRPVEAVQKLERELQFNDPERPVYKAPRPSPRLRRRAIFSAKP